MSRLNGKVIFEKENGTKVYEMPNGSYIVTWKGVYNFDGFLDPVTYGEEFGADNYQYSWGCICRHNMPYECKDDRTPKERALAYAKGL